MGNHAQEFYQSIQKSEQDADAAEEALRLRAIEAAREQYGSEGEIEIDDIAQVSEVKENPGKGVWVQAWVWVSLEEGEAAGAKSLGEYIQNYVAEEKRRGKAIDRDTIRTAIAAYQGGAR